MQEGEEDVEEQQNNVLLCFFMAVHGEQVKSAHFFLKAYDQLRFLLSAIYQKVHDDDNADDGTPKDSSKD